MGTHISRVKSVDLDAWTDEQLQSVTRWGNSRANQYWEAKLAQGHVPSETKIENFIRTKYESRRWVMDGPMPSDPSSLDGAVAAEPDDDNVPLTQVQERMRQRAPSTRSQPPMNDLLGNEPVRPSTVEPVIAKAVPRSANAPDSLLGLDFGGGRPTGAPSQPSKPDFKQSILSLYASTPKPQSAPPTGQASTLDDAFGNLNVKAPDVASGNGTSDLLSGGTFFDSKPSKAPSAPKPAPAAQIDLRPVQASNFANFDLPRSAGMNDSLPLAASAKTVDLFAMDEPSTAPASASPFMLSTPAKAQPALKTEISNASASKLGDFASSKPATDLNTFSTSDAWGSSDAWSTPDVKVAAVAPKADPAPPAVSALNDDFSAWSKAEPSKEPVQSTDDEFGGWSSAAPVAPAAPAPAPAKASGFGGEDLFSNVWE